MTYDQGGQGWKQKNPHITILELAYTFDIVDIPKVGNDFFRVPSHMTKLNYTMLGALSMDPIISSYYDYVAKAFYYPSNPVSGVYTKYHQDIQEGRQSVDPNNALYAWVKDYSGNWKNVGYNGSTDATKIGGFDFLTEIYYEGSMDLPSTSHNHAWIRWIRTTSGWQKPYDVITPDGSLTQGTWAKCSWAWVNKEIHFEAWIQN